MKLGGTVFFNLANFFEISNFLPANDALAEEASTAILLVIKNSTEENW